MLYHANVDVRVTLWLWTSCLDLTVSFEVEITTTDDKFGKFRDFEILATKDTMMLSMIITMSSKCV